MGLFNRGDTWPALRQPSGALYSSPANFSGWSGTDATLAANAFRSPDRKRNGAVITEAATGPTGHYAAVNTGAAVGAVAVKYSATVKRVTGVPNFMLQCFSTDFGSTAKVGVSLDTGVITTAAVTTGSFSAASAAVRRWRFGWWIVDLLYTSKVDTATILVLQGINGVLTESYVGDVGNSFAVWGIDFR